MGKTRAGKSVLGVAAALAFLALAGPPPAQGESAVGLEARGVNPWAALRNRWGLDVRDEMNRPVSARLIESELKAAGAQAASQTAYASKLASARLLIRLLEMLPALCDILKLPAARAPGAGVWALPPPGSLRLFLAVVLACVLFSSPRAEQARVHAAASAPCSRLPLVLRC